MTKSQRTKGRVFYGDGCGDGVGSAAVPDRASHEHEPGAAATRWFDLSHPPAEASLVSSSPAHRPVNSTSGQAPYRPCRVFRESCGKPDTDASATPLMSVFSTNREVDCDWTANAFRAHCKQIRDEPDIWIRSSQEVCARWENVSGSGFTLFSGFSAPTAVNWCARSHRTVE
jgi:hypothetical protein